MQSPNVALLQAALLLWADSPVLYGLIIPDRHAENVTNFGADKISASAYKFTDFRQTIAVYSSEHRRPIKKS
jgi:hypothetical protein